MGRRLGATREVVGELKAKGLLVRYLRSLGKSLEVTLLQLVEKCKMNFVLRRLRGLILFLILAGLCLLYVLFLLLVLGSPLNLMFDLARGPGLLLETIEKLGSFLSVWWILSISLLVVPLVLVLVWARPRILLLAFGVLVGPVVLYGLFGPVFDFLLGFLLEWFDLPPESESTNSFLRERLEKLNRNTTERWSVPSDANSGLNRPAYLKSFLNLLNALVVLIFLIFITHLIIVLTSLGRSYNKMRQLDLKISREFIKGVVPVLLFSLGFASVACVIIVSVGYVAPAWLGSPTVVPGLIAITLTLFVAFGLSGVLPMTWYRSERLTWRISFGGSTTAKIQRRQALKDFQLSIRQQDIDKGFQAPIAILLALGVRLCEFPFLYHTFKRRKVEKEIPICDRTIQRMNRGWKSGEPPELLRSYMVDIMESSRHLKEERRLRAECAVASVRYLIGDIRGATNLAIKNWERAKKLKKGKNRKTGSPYDPKVRWWASYAYLHTKSLSVKKRELENTMNLLGLTQEPSERLGS